MKAFTPKGMKILKITGETASANEEAAATFPA